MTVIASRFADKVAIVTGAASGIGRATALRLAGEGVSALVITDRNEQGLSSLASELPDSIAVFSQAADIGVEQDCQQLVQAAHGAFGRIDVLCNNAGIVCSRAVASEQHLDEWQRVMQVNVFGLVAMTKYVSRLMQQQHSGAIVNTASVAGLRSGAGGNAYSASKAAVINFTQTSACDLGQFGIRVNAVCPGLVETGMTRPFFERARSKGVEHRLGERCELRRAGQPREVAAAIAFLASEDASYVTGQALPVDGGNSASLNMPGMKV